MTACLLYMKCAVSCQKWLTFFIFISEAPQTSTGPPAFVLPHHKVDTLFVSHKLRKLWKYLTTNILLCRGPSLTDSSHSPHEHRNRRWETKEKCCLSPRVKKKKSFSIRKISSHVFIAKCVFLSISSPCANETAGWWRPPSHLLIEERLKLEPLLLWLCSVSSQGNVVWNKDQRAHSCSLQRLGILVIMNLSSCNTRTGLGMLLPLCDWGIICGRLRCSLHYMLV